MQKTDFLIFWGQFSKNRVWYFGSIEVFKNPKYMEIDGNARLSIKKAANEVFRYRSSLEIAFAMPYVVIASPKNIKNRLKIPSL